MIGDRWGATADEMQASYPCDEYVPAATLRAWRAVTIQAPVSRVWSWLLQLRLAPYSYDWIDNRGRPSPHILLHLDDPAVGDPFSRSGGRPLGHVVALAHEGHLTGQILGATMTYRVISLAPVGTRLIVKVVAGYPRLLVPAMSVGDLVMARRQLLNLRRHAEQC